MDTYSTSIIQLFALLTLFLIILIYYVYHFLQSFKSKSLLKKNKTHKRLKCLSWDDFELLCMELFTKMGWRVRGNEKKGADGGVDIWMQKKSWKKKNISAIVQCKRYDDALVSIKVIREMYGLMHEYGVDEVYVVTTNRFTKECHSFVKEKKMTLIAGEDLIKLIDKYA